MRKKLFVFLITAIRGYSLYYGSPNLPDTAVEGFFISKDCSFGLKLGYQGDCVFDKSLSVTNPRIVKSIQQIHYHMQQGVITANFIDRFEVFASLGEIQFHINPRVTSLLYDTFNTGNRFTWGFGGRGILFTFSQAAIGLDFKYQLASPHFQWITENGVPVHGLGNAKLRYREWQLGLGLSYQSDIFTPYIGATYCQMQGEYKKLASTILPNHQTHFTMKSRKKFGMAVGTTLSTGKIFEMDLEARLINETAVSITGNVRF